MCVGELATLQAVTQCSTPTHRNLTCNIHIAIECSNALHAYGSVDHEITLHMYIVIAQRVEAVGQDKQQPAGTACRSVGSSQVAHLMICSARPARGALSQNLRLRQGCA